MGEVRTIKARTIIYVTTQFVGYHRFIDAPDEVRFLRDFHRHVFHVKAAVQVLHEARSVEFFQLKKHLEEYIRAAWSDLHFENSCESIANHIADYLNRSYDPKWVEVSEDGENGAIVYWEEA